VNESIRSSAQFAGRNRTINAEDEIALTSVGIDIGSATSHLVFSRILMERRGFTYAVKSRQLLFESEMLLTPYIEGTRIDAEALGTFVDAQYERAGLSLDAIDTGALILTGVAVRRANARAIGDALALAAGKLVAVSAGDYLETTLVAQGSGALQWSAREPLRVMNVDIGGGTSKIAVCERGEIVDRTVIDVGARLVCFDAEGRVTAVEEAGRTFAAAAGIPLALGAPLSAAAARRLVECMADSLFQAMGALPMTQATRGRLRLPPLRASDPPDLLLFSGGVSEYLHAREQRAYGDLGPLLAAAIQRRAESWGVVSRIPLQGIRATVIGASQYTVQVSGNTIFVAPDDALPLRNLMVLRPRLALESETLAAGSLAAEIRRALAVIEPEAPLQAVALWFSWGGSASYGRLDAFCRGIIEGLEPLLSQGAALVLVTDADVGGLIGLHCHEILGLTNPIVSIDGIALSELDFIDVGALIDSSGAVPVVVKSLLFPVPVASQAAPALSL
jgi:ethanolamine utilization protein EutA